jgi:hypothetical protein
MNRIALHAESPGHEPEPPDAWSRLSEVHCPVLVVVGDLDLVHIQAALPGAGLAHPRRAAQVMEGRPTSRPSSSRRRSPPSCGTSWPARRLIGRAAVPADAAGAGEVGRHRGAAGAGSANCAPLV